MNLNNIGKNVLITDDELVILKKYNIVVNAKSTIEEILFLIDMFFNEAYDISDEEYDELEIVANNLAERKYYMGTNK